MTERRAHWDFTVEFTPEEAALARVRALAEQASTVIARGCTCYGDDCTGKCRRGEPMGWDLDPAQVLAALGSVQHDQSVVNEALLHCARAGESADRQAVERVRALHKACTETPLEEGGCGPGDCDYQICAHDTEEWPCLTIRALENGEQ